MVPIFWWDIQNKKNIQLVRKDHWVHISGVSAIVNNLRLRLVVNGTAE